MNESSIGFARVNFTDALHVDKDMFLRVQIHVNNDNSSLDKLILDIVCWQPHQLFSFVKGNIQIPIARESVCEKDVQSRNDSLCRNTSRCPKDSLCSRVVNAKERCVSNTDQLFVVLPAIKEEKMFCKYESCLQDMLRDPDSGCLSTLNGMY